MLVLVTGDLHIPHRAADLPAKFKKMLTPGKIQHILCTGNLCSKDAENYLRQICSDVNCVKGDFDDPSMSKDTPEYVVVKLGNFRIGVIHGHQVVPWGDRESLAIWQRRLDVDVLVYGGTHQYVTFEYEGKFFVNPGSITGAFSCLDGDVVPTFVLMDINENRLTNFVYQLEGDELKVKKKEFTKPSAE
jgi:vacuolar protein sorting-associated protein 29|uniref:Vacuolar protein sorting-associated protein 29 n=2 Tax=Eutreptiella gymnastica TaxID=73025 RepID=A0A7S4FFQ8_9EUGL|mmetsp:Transcript_10416/g.19609  ORF Transcript_10416/g.19609 Transcript_10416/m.19609 type:complete len:189 (+) Transcript_10416:56-622(+)|eukprot:CAMPEP_0174305974 /NCGR_PEP_ID=MMETSP0810-20121108/150_1 /TAXON_ID=73025 ORGANISM="Eutreptiella gymnastica-like, Strain CCMP1594" /NCGR_SAMPLE_ID=MMETSP0810 /ASSEMBLY_ACC=CAM_ASM_000659 /LENGTH=188 /DNA_ID=CAMNT_0015412551 /DNA_START=98 /DNA_END=664 /DNA_ORIENTATION=+